MTQRVDEVRTAVRERYAAAALEVSGSRCTAPVVPADEPFGSSLYAAADAAAVPGTALLASLGCGNPTALAELRAGEVVLDLGSGGGIDVLLSARRVGPTGKAYGLDMTPEMLDLARRNQAEAGVDNAEFLLGTIEEVPLPDASVDVVISNCVINLSGDKPAVLREAFRVLRPGGRFAVSDIVLRRALPVPVREVIGVWTGCVAGALLQDEYRTQLHSAGFVGVDVQPTQVYDRADLAAMAREMQIPDSIDIEQTLDDIEGAVMSAFVRARKPAA